MTWPKTPNTQIKDIREEFGDTVADIVDGATKISDIFKSHDVTQAESYRKMLLSMVNDIRVMLVKFADRLHNMRTLEYLPPDKQKRMAQGNARYLCPVRAPVRPRRTSSGSWKTFPSSTSTAKPTMTIARDLKSRRREREHYIGKFVQPIEKRLQGGRVQVRDQRQAEAPLQHLQQDDQAEQAARRDLRPLCDPHHPRHATTATTASPCTAPSPTSTSRTPNGSRTTSPCPKKNGYQSIHTTVVGPEGKMVEVQIRTRAMHEVAEKGIAAHWMYKENLPAIDEELANWVNWVRDIFENAAEGQVPTAAADGKLQAEPLPGRDLRLHPERGPEDPPDRVHARSISRTRSTRRSATTASPRKSTAGSSRSTTPPEERRPGGDHHLEEPDPQPGLGKVRRHAQGEVPYPPVDQGGAAEGGRRGEGDVGEAGEEGQAHNQRR